MTPLTIAPSGPKGRSFSANLLSYAVADGLWDSGNTENRRPIWMTVAGSELETKAFVANLLTGRIAEAPNQWRRKGGPRYELLKSAGYAHHTVKIGGGVVASIYLRDLVSLDPGLVDPDGIRFLMLPSTKWAAKQGADAEGALFLLMLDRRSRYPMPQDPRFGARLLEACLVAGIASRSAKWEPGHYRLSYDRESDGHGRFGFYVHKPEKAGVNGGVAVATTHEMFGKVLAETVRAWFGHTDAFVDQEVV